MEFTSQFILLTLACLGAFAMNCHGAMCTYTGSPGETGSVTASGEPFDALSLTCSAGSHVPFGTVIRVQNQRNGRSIDVRVTDRFGSPPSQDTIDLTYGAFSYIASHDDGVVPCSYTMI